MNKLIVLNHKMTLEYDEVFPYIKRINDINTKNDLIICPSNIYLNEFINHCNWGIGTQNISLYEKGNYTGEVSILQLKSIGIEYAIIGHYERKKYFQEKDIDINKKLIYCLESNIIPILCFGETGSFNDITKSLDTLLKDIEKIDFIIFAYEPLKIKENIEDIKAMTDKIYSYLFEKYKTKPNIIYGGGINKSTVKEVLKIDKLNGLLIGSISSDIDKIEKIINES